MLSKTKFSVLDLETTSLDVKKAGILSLAVVPMLGTKILISDYYSTFVKPGEMDAKSIKIHGIDLKAIEHAPKFEELADTVLEKLEGSIIVGCHIGFDVGILGRYFKKQNLKFKTGWVDILPVERFLSLRQGIRKDIDVFDDLLEMYDLDDSYRHSAAADAYLSAHIFQFQLKKLISYKVTLKELLKIGKRREFTSRYIG